MTRSVNLPTLDSEIQRKSRDLDSLYVLLPGSLMSRLSTDPFATCLVPNWAKDMAAVAVVFVVVGWREIGEIGRAERGHFRVAGKTFRVGVKYIDIKLRVLH